MNAVYLDHNATTPLDPAVRDEMLPWLDPRPANPSSLHAFGQHARRAVDQARVRVARLIGARPDEIIFTSGGTEADNLAILGAAASNQSPTRLVTTAIEHQAVLNPGLHIRRLGGSLTLAPVDAEGRLDPDTLLSSLPGDTTLVSVMLANNDVGTIQPVAALAEPLHRRGVLLHTDAVQAAGKIPIDVEQLGVDLLSLSGHKLHGPQGSGALYVRRNTRLSPILFGGHQERTIRPGTENVAAIAGFGKACELARERLDADAAHMLALRTRFEQAILERIPGVTINGRGAPRLPNTTNLSFEGLDGELLVLNLDLLGIAASTGAACSSADREPSHVLLAMGRTPAQARSSVRFSFGRDNRDEDVPRAVESVVRAVQRMREGRR
ncbi:MAG: cysteine desulfurase [Myxococcales bacterium]|nr:cysteine desulfurase [Myxococcales bacterium]